MSLSKRFNAFSPGPGASPGEKRSDTRETPPPQHSKPERARRALEYRILHVEQPALTGRNMLADVRSPGLARRRFVDRSRMSSRTQRLVARRHGNCPLGGWGESAMSDLARGGAVFMTATVVFWLLPVNGLLLVLAVLFALRRREAWEP
jgi:hypothetical protein